MTRLPARERATYLEAGIYQTHAGSFVALESMVDSHLVNALLRALADDEPKNIVEPLAEELTRRGLEAVAIAEVHRREMQS